MDMMEFLRTRRTCRRFEQRPVEQTAIDDMLEAARICSCAANLPKLRYAVVQNPEVVAQCFPLVKWAGYLPPEQGVPKEGEKPVMFLAVIQTKTGGYADTDAGLALGSITAAAWAHGVGSCIMGAIDRAALAPILGVREGEHLHTIVAMGYPSHTSAVVPMEDSVKYYLDENGNYCVPKQALTEMVQTI